MRTGVTLAQVHTFTGKEKTVLLAWIHSWAGKKKWTKNKYTKLFNFPFNTFRHPFQSTQRCVQYISDPKCYDIININIWKWFVCLVVWLFVFVFAMNSKSAYFRVFYSSFPCSSLCLSSAHNTFCFLLFFYFIGKGEHSLTHSHTHVMCSQMAQFPVYIQLWTLFFYNDRISLFLFYVATLTSCAFHTNGRASCEHPYPYE